VKGQIVWFSAPKGYGFVKASTTDDEYFVHFSNIVEMDGYKKLDQGDTVEFEVSMGPRGRLQAENIRLVK
jgi:CspA family cold shock protein